MDASVTNGYYILNLMVVLSEGGFVGVGAVRVWGAFRAEVEAGWAGVDGCG